MDEVWVLARKQTLMRASDPDGLAALIPEICPLGLDDLLRKPLDVSDLVGGVQRSAAAVAGC